MLESKKLSNKINYNVLANMFDMPSSAGQDCDVVIEEEEGPITTAAAAASYERDDVGVSGSLPLKGKGGRRVAGSGTGTSGSQAGEPVTSVSAALQQRAQRRAADKELSMNKYSHVLEREAKRRGVVGGASAVMQAQASKVGVDEVSGGSGSLPAASLGGLGGLSGGFLGSLTFAPKQVPGLRATTNRPRSSGLRDR
jgi:hypothetical protein